MRMFCSLLLVLHLFLSFFSPKFILVSFDSIFHAVFLFYLSFFLSCLVRFVCWFFFNIMICSCSALFCCVVFGLAARKVVFKDCDEWNARSRRYHRCYHPRHRGGHRVILMRVTRRTLPCQSFTHSVTVVDGWIHPETKEDTVRRKTAVESAHPRSARLTAPPFRFVDSSSIGIWKRTLVFDSLPSRWGF